MTHALINMLGAALEVAGVALLIAGLLLAFARSVRAGQQRFLRLRHDIGRAILLGLEVLVAADIVRSVTLAPTMGGLVVLATLIVIRTFLSWSLALELDRRWPWQRPASPTLPQETP